MDEQKVSWVPDRKFSQDSIVVTVWKLPLRRPQFRFEIGCKGKEEGQVYRQFSVRSEGKGKLTFLHAWDPDVASNLVAQALEYIYGERQANEDEFIDRQTAWEQKGLAKDKPKQKLGLKELAKRDKALRQFRQQQGDKS